MLLLGSLEKGTPEDFMAVSVAFVKLATLGVGALLGQGYDVKALATVSVPMGELVDIVFHSFDVAKRRRLRSLCDCLAAELAARIRGRDPGTVTSARLEAEHLLASFGLREERLVELGLDARLAAGELLCQASFTADEKAEIEPLCEELLVCFYERLKDQHEFIQDLLPNIYGELLRDTKAIRGDVRAVRDDLGAIRDLLARPAEARLAKALPETRLLHGRDAELSTLLAMLLDADRRPVLVHGGPGMGKTALTVAALHDAAVVERFGERRFFADLDEVRTGEGVLDRVAASMGEAEGPGAATRALRALTAAPALLVLDNLETPWEGQGPETGRALAQLAALPGLRLLASIRGDEKPGQIRWRRLDEMAPLDDGQARTLFLDVSEGFGAADPDLGRLLALLGGVPLAIDLVARRVEETGVASLVADWRQRRTRAAARGAANDREISLHVSIELSLASPRLGGSSRRLFAMLGQLPGGLDPGDAEALLAEPGLAAMAGLRHAGLARIEAGRLRMLPPIREHALDTPPEPGDRQRLQDHFLGLARALDRLESGSDRTADVGRLRAELVNVEAVLEQLMTAEPEPADGSYTGRELAWLSLAVGNVRTRLGQLSPALAAFERAHGFFKEKAESTPLMEEWQRDLSISWNKLGDVRVAQGDLAGALQAFEAARAIRERLADSDPGNAGWQRDLSVSWNKLGDVRVAQGDLAGALQAYEAGRAIRERLAGSDPGNAVWQRDLSVSWEKLGDVRRAQGDLAGALQAYEAGHAIRERLAGSDPGNAGWQRDLIASHWRIADAFEKVAGRKDDAREHWAEALRVARLLANSGRLAPTDSYFVPALERRLAASAAE